MVPEPANAHDPEPLVAVLGELVAEIRGLRREIAAIREAPPAERLLTVPEKATELGRSREWVREHRHELGVVAVGHGTKPRLYFPPMSASNSTEPWIDKRGLAEHLACSVRSIQTALAEGLPHTVIFGRVKFQVSVVEAWLEERGHLVRHNGDRSRLEASRERAGSADTPRPRTRGEAPHASTQG